MPAAAEMAQPMCLLMSVLMAHPEHPTQAVVVVVLTALSIAMAGALVALAAPALLLLPTVLRSPLILVLQK